MSLRDALVRNVNDLAREHQERAPHYDTRCGAVIGPRVAGTVAKQLGASVDVLAPGKMSCPYHFHYAQEEMFIILEGEGTLRVADERIPIRAGDVIGIPAGPPYPHQIINTSAAPLRYLSISTQQRPDVCEYPDSNKYGVFTGDPAGAIGGWRVHRTADDLDYWDGEP